MDVGEDRHVEPGLDVGEHAQPLDQAGPAKGPPRCAVRLVVRGFEDELHADAACDVDQRSGQGGGVVRALDGARTRDQHQSVVASDDDVVDLDGGHGQATDSVVARSAA